MVAHNNGLVLTDEFRHALELLAGGKHVFLTGKAGTGKSTLIRHVVPNVAAGATKSGRSPSDIAVIVPVMTIVGDSDEERHHERELAGFEGTTARIREKQKAGDFKGMTGGEGRWQ